MQIPPGWVLTSGNASQVVRFRHLQGSVTGLVAQSPPAPVGLAPVLNISGRVTRAGDGGESVANDIRLSAVDPGGASSLPPWMTTAHSHSMQCPAAGFAGEYLSTGEMLRRELVVSDGPVRIATLQFGQELPEPLASRFIQDFDYLTPRP